MKHKKTRKEKIRSQARKQVAKQSEKVIDESSRDNNQHLKGERKIDFSYLRHDLTKSLALTMLALGIEIWLWYLWR